MNNTYEIRPIGYVRSGLRELHEAPRQGREAGTPAEITILPQYADALEGIAARKKLIVITWMDRADREMMKIVPRGVEGAHLEGVLNTRTPNRPNPLGLCVVELLGLDGLTMKVRGLDAVDGTPVVDIKPFIVALDGP